MEEKSESTKKDLEPLPENKHPFWKGAEVNEFKIGAEVNCGIKQHIFVQSSPLEATCQKCNVGYNLPIGSEIRDGHIHIEGKLII